MSGSAVRKEQEEERVVAVIPMPSLGIVTAEEQELESQVSEIELQAAAVVVKDNDSYEEAGKFGVLLKQKAGQVTDFFKPLKDAAHKAHKAICDREKEMLSPLQNAEKTLKKTMGDYAMEQERQRREREEALRKAAEEESKRMLEEAAKLEAAGKAVEAEEALVDAEIMEGAGRMAYVPTAAPKAAGVSSAKDWEIVSIDDKAVPLAINGAMLRPVDKEAVMRLIRASKGGINIPGIVFKEVSKMSFRR